MTKRFVVFILVVLFPVMSIADDCVDALKIDETNIENDLKTKLTFLRLIDERRYNQIKTDGSFKGNFFGFGMKIGSYGTYHKFNEARNSLLKKLQYSLDEEHSYSFLSQRLSNNATKAYLGCLRANTTNSGLYLIAEEITEENVITKVVLNTPSGVSNAKIKVEHLTPSDINSEMKINSTLKDLTSDGEVGVTLKRNKDKDVVLRLNAYDGFNSTGYVLISKEPRIVIPEPAPNSVIEKPQGVIDLVYAWRNLTLANLPDNNCGFGGDWMRYGWHGKSKIEYCYRKGQGDRYLAEMKIIHGTHEGASCVSKFGNQWEYYAWDGKHKTVLCKRMVNFETLKLGNESYVESLSHIWPHPCPAPSSLVVELPYSVKFCGIYKSMGD